MSEGNKKYERLKKVGIAAANTAAVATVVIPAALFARALILADRSMIHQEPTKIEAKALGRLSHPSPVPGLPCP